jgi:hypothetical protein
MRCLRLAGLPCSRVNEGVLFENSIVCLVVFVCCLFFVALWYPRVGV